MKSALILSRSATILLILAFLLLGSVSSAMAGLATSPFTLKNPAPISDFVNNVELPGL